MISTTLFPGRYVQGPDALLNLGPELSRLGKNGLAVCTPYVFDHLLGDIQDNLPSDVHLTTEKFHGECSEEEISRLSTLAISLEAEVIVGIGGGKTLDTAKAVAHERKLPVAIVPTIASTDAPCSALSVVYTEAGKFNKYIFFPKNPDLVLVDTQIIAQAPVRFLVAGMGDALATWFEAESCRAKFATNMSGAYGSITAMALSDLCYKTLLEYGLQAKLACEANVVVPALEHVVEANTLLSGLGFESGGLAAAHSIHNGLTALKETFGYYHGEKVAIGTLASLFLTDKPSRLINEVYTFCETVGLPTTLADVGLSGLPDAALREVAKKACAQGETIHNEPVPVTEDMVFSALKMGDAFGRQRKH